MLASATQLGKMCGMTGEEMNRLLFQQGFLEGEPGDYSPIRKGLIYAVEKDHHRGNGGYSIYNNNWTTRKFDESILKELDLSPENIAAARDEVEKLKLARKAARAEARKKADENFLARQMAEKLKVEQARKEEEELEQIAASLKKAGKIGIIVTVTVVVGYGVYKAVPKVRTWWEERKALEKREMKKNVDFRN